MNGYKSAAVALVAFTLGAAPVAAQDARTVDVTPYVALGSPGTSPVGIAVTLPVASNFGIETEVAYRRGEGHFNALSTNASLVWFLPRIGQATPYLAAGLGLSQYGALVVSSAGAPIGTERRLAMTVNAGGGLKMPVKDRIDLRTDIRWTVSPGAQRPEQLRVAQGISLAVGKR